MNLARPIRLAAEDQRRLFERSIKALLHVLSLRVPRKAWIKQCYEAGNRSLVFLGTTMGFIGMIMVLQSGYQAARLIGDYSLLGPGFLQLLIREFAPTIGALMIATRVGAGIAAEVGSMSVTEQLDALRMCGADPVEELIVPRLAASLIMMPALIILGGLSAELTGLVAARLAFDVPYDVFWSSRLVTSGDVILGLVKAFTFGLVIPLISAHAGMEARNGSEGVGSATTRAVIHTSIAIIFLDFAINVLLYPLYAR